MPVHIIILGGGFGGVYTLLSLRKHMKGIPYTVTLISDKETFSFTPFLSEVVGDMLPSDEAMTHINDLIKKDTETYLQGKVEKIDLANKKTYITSNQECTYDYLVIAIGSTTNFLHVPGAQEHCLVLKDITDATHIKERIDAIFTEATNIQDPEERKRILTFAVIGGGPTGIEIASDMEEHIDHLLHTKHQSIQKAETSVILINSGNEVAKEFDTEMRQKAAELIQKETITLKLNARVKEIQEETVILTDDTTVKAHTIIWSAGVKANTLVVDPTTSIDPNSQKFIVDPFLRLSDYPEVFAIGDIAMFADTTKKLPMLAQAAVSEGICTGKNIGKTLKKQKLHTYSYHSKGELMSVGKGEGIASIYGIDISGRLAWFLWRMIYLYKYIDTRKKPAILYHWILDSFK